MVRRVYKRERSPERIEKVAKVLANKQIGLTVVLENIHDPHNIMAVMRSCDAVGIYEIHIIETVARTWDPRIGKNSSAGAKKWVKQNYYQSVDECYNQLRLEEKKILTTHMAEDSKNLYELDLTQNVALVFGNEHNGISEEALEKADGNFLIPQYGMIQSLNISVACAISVFEAGRQRLAAKMYDKPQFTDAEYNHLQEEWLMK
jgi:tRNA (guanosine-2'-O-)-methyltransferase